MWKLLFNVSEGKAHVHCRDCHLSQGAKGFPGLPGESGPKGEKVKTFWVVTEILTWTYKIKYIIKEISK